MAETFTLPTPGQIAEIRNELKLTAVQAHELSLVIRHAHADLEGYYRARIGRAQRKVRMDRLKAVDQALGKLISLLAKNPDLINEDLPFDAREAIAWCASSQLIAEVTKEKITRAKSRLSHKEQAVGLNHGARLLAAQLTLIRDPIRKVLEEKSTDPGGLEPNHVRTVLIRALAASAPDIIGRRATGTAKGKFGMLVGAVFRELNVETDGIERAIESALYRKPSLRKSRK